MDYSEKRNKMKITESLNSNVLANKPKSVTDWNSDYYWLHQNQLEQSVIQFDAKELKEKTTRTEENLIAEYEEVTTEQQKQELNLSDTVNADSCTEKKLNIHNQNQQSSIDVYQYKNDKMSHVCEFSQQKQLFTEAKILKTNINNLFSKPIEFKNNHLFIQEDKAELTLNLQRLDQQEQKDLIQMIKDYLKKKGLTLSRFIINGVSK